MSCKLDFATASSQQIEGELCQRLERIRLMRNITQRHLATEAGVSVRTIKRLENGEGVSFNTFIRVLIALRIQQNLALLLPDPTIRPMERVRFAGRERKRARSTQKKPSSQKWQWGDEDDAS